MNDPFFDEDDGAFDDLYGNPPPSASSKHKLHNHETLEVQSITQSRQSFDPSLEASGSAVSRSYTCHSLISNATDSAASGKRCRRRGKARRKGSQDMFDVQWEANTKVAMCGLCKSDFSLVKRKHHCRPCGRVICSACSFFLYFEFSHRKHRVCATCNKQLLSEQDAYERETMTGRETDWSETRGPTSFRRTHKDGDSKTQDKQEKERWKEQRARNKSQKQEMAAKGSRTLTPFRKQAMDGEKKRTGDGMALFDSADEGWFTDVPNQQTGSRDDGAVENEDGNSGWRDHVKDTYTVTSVLAPMSGSSLTAGITGNGYISDQFRYDVSGPGLGHDDDVSVEMPRPVQQIASSTRADQSVKPRRLTETDLSEPLRYERDSATRGHADDCSIAMPRPRQHSLAMFYSNERAAYHRKKLKRRTNRDSTRHERDIHARFTIADVFSGSKRRESTVKKKEQGAKASKPRARGTQNMTLDEFDSSYSSQDEFCTRVPTVSNVSASRPTFYDQDADKLLVDDSPGYFEATMEEREAQHEKEEEKHERFARDMAWASKTPLPPSVQPRRFSSDQESYSIVDHPSHTSNSPVGHPRAKTNSAGASEKTKSSGFTGALKRLFGMGPKKAATPPKTQSKPAKPPPKSNKTPPAVAALREKDSASGEHRHDESVMSSNRLLRHTVADYNAVYREESASHGKSRHSTAAFVHGNSRVRVSLPSQAGGTKELDEKQESEYKRRGTFDELFMSPKDSVATDKFTDRFTTGSATGWTARVEEKTNGGRASVGVVGVARFDQRRPVDEAEEFVLEKEPVYAVRSNQSTGNSTDAWRESAALSLLNDRKAATQSEGSGFTWSTIRSTPGLGTPTYAVPSSLQPREVYSDTIEASAQDGTRVAQRATIGSIMDDLKYGSTSKRSQGKESIDEFFAEFEETNDYVFDATTGGYVAAQAPARAAIPRNVKRTETTEVVVSEDVTSRRSNRDYKGLSPLARTVMTPNDDDDDDEEIEDENAGIIVDKIDSLESELAALKQLICSRRGSGGNVSSKSRLSRSGTKSRVRKESIFDDDSSDEDGDKKASYASIRRSVVKQGSKRRPGSKKKLIMKRRDSFADLFEDSPNEHEVFGGATSYEALFQTDAKLSATSKDDVSDEDADSVLQVSRSRVGKPRRRSGRTMGSSVLSNEDSNSEPDFISLKERRSKQLSRRKTQEDEVDTIPNMNEGQFVVSPVRLAAKQRSPAKQVEEEDSIDALFDASNDRDVTKLYNDDIDGDEKHQESNSASVLEDKRVLLRQKSCSDGKRSGGPAAVAAPMISAASMSQGSPSYSCADSQGSDEVDEDEGFSINWSKMRKSRPRRHQSPRSSSAAVVRNAADKAANDDVLKPSLGIENVDFKGTDASAQLTVSTALLVDASADCMPVAALEDKAVELSLADGDLESQSVPQSKDTKAATTEIVVTNENKRDDQVEAVVAGEAIDRSSFANVSSAEEPFVTKVKMVREDEATFDIFDKSGDVDFLSISSPMDLKALDRTDVSDDSEDEDKESLEGNDEVVNFEIQAPKKRSVVAVPPTTSSLKSTSCPSPTSAADESVELGKYATFAGQSSSRAASVDCRLDDVEDTPVEDSALGKAESQAFDTDWQQMQVKEKERKKRLQVKQRQAQRDKLLRKQGASTKSVSGSAAAHSSSKSKSKSGKKKKKDKTKDDAASSSSLHKKSGSSRKHRQDATTSSEPPRSLTEL